MCGRGFQLSTKSLRRIKPLGDSVKSGDVRPISCRESHNILETLNLAAFGGACNRGPDPPLCKMWITFFDSVSAKLLIYNKSFLVKKRLTGEGERHRNRPPKPRGTRQFLGAGRVFPPSSEYQARLQSLGFFDIVKRRTKGMRRRRSVE